MLSPNPTASTQGRGFDSSSEGRTPTRFKTNRLRVLLVLACLAPLATGCRAFPAVAQDGATARLVAAVGAADVRADDALADFDRPMLAAR